VALADCKKLQMSSHLQEAADVGEIKLIGLG
jgi:hypothetical protein